LPEKIFKLADGSTLTTLFGQGHPDPAAFSPQNSRPHSNCCGLEASHLSTARPAVFQPESFRHPLPENVGEDSRATVPVATASAVKRRACVEQGGQLHSRPVAKKSPHHHPELGLPEVRKLWQTEGLFSDHYLKARIQKNSWWPTEEQAGPIWQFCKELYDKRYLACAKNNEEFTRQELIEKILDKLGFLK
jgi:hypothetical protein